MNNAFSKVGYIAACESREYGPIFEAINIDDVAAQCVRAACAWGGGIAVYVGSNLMVKVVVANSANDMRMSKSRHHDRIGAYEIADDEGPVWRSWKSPALQSMISEDIWHHIQQMKEAKWQTGREQKSWRADDDKKLAELVDSGTPVKLIAKETGRTKSSVWNRMNRKGMRLRA